MKKTIVFPTSLSHFLQGTLNDTILLNTSHAYHMALDWRLGPCHAVVEYIDTVCLTVLLLQLRAIDFERLRTIYRQ